ARSIRTSAPLPIQVITRSSPATGNSSAYSAISTAAARPGALSTSVPSRSKATPRISSNLFMTYLCQFTAHFINDLFVVWLIENGRTSDEHIGTCRSGFANVVHLHAAVHFQSNVEARLVDTTTYFAQFIQCLRNERLTAETRVDGHQQDHIQLIHHVIQIAQRCR